MKLMILNGPSINFTGIREVHVYGRASYPDMVKYIEAAAERRWHSISVRQSNHEGVLIDWLQEAYLDRYDGIVINPGALTHTSYALADAIVSIGLPAVEVHLSHVMKRESFRHLSVTAQSCIGQIAGFGAESYVLAMDALERNAEHAT